MVSEQMLCIIATGWQGSRGRIAAAWPSLHALLAGTGRVHFAALALLPPLPERAGDPPSLLLELVVDAGLRTEDLIDILVGRDAHALLEVFGSFCPRTATDQHAWLRAFLISHTNHAAGGFVGARDRALAQIRLESDLLMSTRAFCRSLPPRVRADAGSAASRLADWANRSAMFEWAALPAPRSFWRAGECGRRLLIALAVLAVATLFVALVLWLGFWWALGIAIAVYFGWSPIRRLLDRATDGEVPGAQQVHPSVDVCEAHLVGRVAHMISLTDVRRPAWLYGAMLRFWLWLISLLGHVWFTESRLGTASGIKFGHWHLVDRGRRLLFCSNYDGSFGGYLDEFIGGASIGINLIWRWTELLPRSAADADQPEVTRARSFPPTRALGMFSGCKHEVWFKTYARDSMLPHLHRFEAYCTSGDGIERATRLRNALFGSRSPVNDDAVLRALES